jgi:cholesterol oxidase
MPGDDFDLIVIGSGFGGSVMTCRLSERGHRVCLLERGKEYGMYEFPRRMEDVRERVFWDPKDGKYGFMEVRDYPESDVASVSASGLGGGSLIYANVLMRMPPEHFAGWPGGITRERLDPFYDRALEMLEASPYPFETDPYYADTPKTAAFKAAAFTLSASDDATVSSEFVFPDLAIRFEGDFPGHQTPNRQGVIQSRCTKCGECDIGCNIHAKNTLDLNYLARARQLPGTAADIRTRAEVQEIRPLATGGYEVTYADPELPLDRHSVTAKRVVVSAGPLGSTGLLLRMKRDGLLPQLSQTLGKKWCGNGDLEGTVLFADDQIVPTNGPVITAAVQYRFGAYPDGFPHGAVIQDAGFPPFIAWYLVGKLPSIGSSLRAFRLLFRAVVGAVKDLLRIRKRGRDLSIGNDITDLIDNDDYVRHTLLLLGMGRDRSDGHIELRDDGEPVIKWRIDASSLHYNRVRHEMKKIAEALGGRFLENPLSKFDKIIAVHPLGGCAMADSERDGVVDPNGEAFGHPGLYVVDASILPTSVGPNPSLTIAAVAEYIAERFPEADHRQG